MKNIIILLFLFTIYSMSFGENLKPDGTPSFVTNVDKYNNLIVADSTYTYTYDTTIGSTTYSGSVVDFLGICISSTSASASYDIYDSTFVNVTVGAVLDASQLIMSIPAGTNGNYTFARPIRTKRGLAKNQTAQWKVMLIYKP